MFTPLVGVSAHLRIVNHKDAAAPPTSWYTTPTQAATQNRFSSISYLYTIPNYAPLMNHKITYTPKSPLPLAVVVSPEPSGEIPDAVPLPLPLPLPPDCAQVGAANTCSKRPRTSPLYGRRTIPTLCSRPPFRLPTGILLFSLFSLIVSL